MRLPPSNDDQNVGFQIAPMIDVVFVIMLFFMVMAGKVTVENELNIKLPGKAPTDTPTTFNDEIVITIDAGGNIQMNGEPEDSPTSSELPQLKNDLVRLRQASDAAKSPTVVTIVSEGDAKYARTIDVLDALAFAKITAVTFTLGDASSGG